MIKKIVLISFVVFLTLASTGCGEKTVNQNNDMAGLVEDVTGITAVKIKQKADRDLAIAQARVIYKTKKALGEDLSSGPCLSNDLIDDWVFDIVHNPRQEIDNLPENQCSAFREGKAHHFVEFDPDGNLIKAE